MRKILLFVFLLFTVKAVAQDYEPYQRMYYYQGWRYLDGNDSLFNPRNFTFNFHWDGSKTISEKFGFRVMHVNSEVPSGTGALRFLDPELDQIADSSWLILNIPRIGHHWSGYKPLYSMCIRYEPTLKIDSLTPWVFHERVGDETRPIFGFKHIRGTIPDNPEDDNYSRLLLEPADLNGQSSILALADPWVSNTFKHTNQYHPPYSLNTFYDDIFNDPNRPGIMPLVETNGDRLYLTVNLRRIDSMDVDTTDEVVLGIRLRYVNLPLSDTSTVPRINGYIKFDSIPRTTAYNRNFYQSGRGKVKYTQPSNRDTIFFITKKMIPLVNDQYNQPDITVSAHFRSVLNEYERFNYYLKDHLFDNYYIEQDGDTIWFKEKRDRKSVV